MDIRSEENTYMVRRRINDPAVGSRLLHIRHKLGLTQERLAEKWNVSQTAIKNFEAGRVPHPTFLLLYSDLGDVTVEWILTGKEDERLISRKISALEPRQRALILQSVDLVKKNNPALENQFKAFLGLLEAAF